MKKQNSTSSSEEIKTSLLEALYFLEIFLSKTFETEKEAAEHASTVMAIHEHVSRALDFNQDRENPKKISRQTLNLMATRCMMSAIEDAKDRGAMK